MALKNPSLLLFGYDIIINNQFIDFKTSSLGPTLTASVQNGTYSLTDLMTQVASALSAQDPSNTYTVTANRNIAGGTQNRVTISTSGAFLSLLFGSGPNAVSSIGPTLGFNAINYTGSTTYTGSFTTGEAIQPVQIGYNWVAPQRNKKIFGSVNISAVGLKEAIVFQVQQFFEVEFKYEPENRVDTIWQDFFDWAIQQKELEFTPDITQPTVFYNCTLESTDEDSQGLAHQMKEQLPEFPGLYQTGKLNFRVQVTAASLIA